MSFDQIKPKLIQFAKHLGFILAFLLLDLTFFSTDYFGDYKLPMHDVKMGNAAGHEAVEYRNETGEEALWTGTMFSGMPAYIIGVKNKGNLIHSFHYPYLRFLQPPGDVVFITFVCFYILMISLRISPWLAFMGAATYAFTTFGIVSVGAGHIFKLLAMAYIPLVLAGFIQIFKQKYLLGGVMFLFGFAFELDSRHPQITYYLLFLLILVGIYFFVETVKNKTWKPFMLSIATLLITGIIGVLPLVPFLWQSAEYNAYSTRGGTELTVGPDGEQSVKETGLRRDYVFDYSSGVLESFTMVIPNLYGGASGLELSKDAEVYKLYPPSKVSDRLYPNHNVKVPAYWGPQERGTAGPVYAGVIIFFLFILGMVVIKSSMKWYILGAFVLFVMLSWGKNFELFNYFMYDHFPLYNKFRTVSMAAVGATFCMPFIAILGLHEFINAENKKELVKKLMVAGAIMLGIFVIVIGFAMTANYIVPGEDATNAFYQALKKDRASLLYVDLFRSLFFVGVAFAVLYFYLKKGISKQVLVYILVAASLTDIYLVDKRYVNETNFTEEKVDEEFRSKKSMFKMTKSDKDILRDTAISYRVMDQMNPFNNAQTSYFHKSIGGYHGAKIRRYQDLIEWYIYKGDNQILDMLNTKYMIAYYKGKDRYGRETRIDTALYRPSHFGNAWFVDELVPVNSADEEIKALADTPLRNKAVIDISKFPAEDTKFEVADAKIQLLEYAPKHLVYSSNSKNDGYVVFSEMYYAKGWVALIDGKEVAHDRVNYVLRGMSVPAGKHKIEFKFEPDSYIVGNKVAMAGSIIFYLVVIGGIGFLAWKELKKGTEPEESSEI